MRLGKGVHVDTAQCDTVISSGVDYITVTKKGARSDSDLAAFGRYLVQQETAAGEEWRDFRFSGYRGQMSGGAQFGVRHDSTIVRLSSNAAAEHWAQAYGLASNVTRLDVQITVLPPCLPSQRLAKHHRESRRATRGKGRPRGFKFWYGPQGPEAAVFGSRQSNLFLRCYDKGLESGLPEFAGCLRYEAELKKHEAVSSCEQLDQTESPEIWIVAKLRKMLEKSRVCLPPLNLSGQVIPEFESLPYFEKNRTLDGKLSERSASDCHVLLGQGRLRKRAAWLEISVAPTIQLLMALGRSDVVLAALGLSLQNGELVSSRSETWSNFEKWR